MTTATAAEAEEHGTDAAATSGDSTLPSSSSRPPLPPHPTSSSSAAAAMSEEELDDDAFADNDDDAEQDGLASRPAPRHECDDDEDEAAPPSSTTTAAARAASSVELTKTSASFSWSGPHRRRMHPAAAAASAAETEAHSSPPPHRHHRRHDSDRSLHRLLHPHRHRPSFHRPPPQSSQFPRGTCCLGYEHPIWHHHRTSVRILIALALHSILGEVFRLVTEQIFGEACHAPSSYEWNESGWAPCTTDPGGTARVTYGGAFFVDLPANVLGCFLMGLLVSADSVLGSAVDVPIAALPRHSKLQLWTATHVGLRTGLCGTFTTFASWNAQMVLMMLGGNGTAVGKSQWVSAVWGYVVGLTSVMASYGAGKHVAIVLHRWHDPELAVEADVIAARRFREEVGGRGDIYTGGGAGDGYVDGGGGEVHRDLPDFERRFLHDLDVEIDRQMGKRTTNRAGDAAMQEIEGGEQEQRSGDVGVEEFIDDEETARADDGCDHAYEVKEVEEGRGAANPQHRVATSGSDQKAPMPHDDDDEEMVSFHTNHHASHVKFLARWKETTHDHRTGRTPRAAPTILTAAAAKSVPAVPVPVQQQRPRSPPQRQDQEERQRQQQYAAFLREIERAILIDEIEPREELLDVARDAGWDVEALRRWKVEDDDKKKGGGNNKQRSDREHANEDEWRQESSPELVPSSFTSAFSKARRRSTSVIEPWSHGYDIILHLPHPHVPHAPPYYCDVETAVTASLLVVLTALLLWGTLVMDGTDAPSVAWRTSFLSCLLAPAGTYARYRLSTLNGSIKQGGGGGGGSANGGNSNGDHRRRNSKPSRWEWLPLGTLLANLIASVVSCVMVGIKLKLDREAQHVAVAVAGAIKGGFAGSMSTVSTFAAETEGLIRVGMPRRAWGYYYAIGSLVTACVLGMASYAWAIV